MDKEKTVQTKHLFDLQISFLLPIFVKASDLLKRFSKVLNYEVTTKMVDIFVEGKIFLIILLYQCIKI